MQNCPSCPAQSCNVCWGWRGGTDYLQGISGMRLPCNLLGGRGKHLIAQHDCEDGGPPCLQRDLCWSKTTAWPWEGLLLCRVMAVVAGNVFPFGACWKTVPVRYVYVYLLFCRSTKAGPGLRLSFAGGLRADVLMSPSEICSHFLQLVALRPHGA